MASLAEVVSYQSTLTDLATLTIAELLAFWQSLDTEDAAGSAEALRQFLPDLVDSYLPVAAEVGAVFYDEARDQAGVAGAFAATPVGAANAGRIQATISWGVAPLFRSDPITERPAPDPDLALSRLSGATQREVAEGARQTVVDSVEKDPAKPRFARHASANACTFCRLVATRGAVYRSAASAGDGHKYHDNCHCVVVPVWKNDYEPAPYVSGWESAYVKARRDGAADTKSVLAHMRQSLGSA